MVGINPCIYDDLPIEGHRLTTHPWNDWDESGFSDHQKKKTPAKRTAGRHLQVAMEKPISPQSPHMQTKYQYAGKSLTKTKPRQGKDAKELYATYYFEETLKFTQGDRYS